MQAPLAKARTRHNLKRSVSGGPSGGSKHLQSPRNCIGLTKFRIVHPHHLLLVLVPPSSVNRETRAAADSNHKDFSSEANPSKKWKKKRKFQEHSQNLVVQGLNQIAWVPILILLTIKQRRACNHPFIYFQFNNRKQHM